MYDKSKKGLRFRKPFLLLIFILYNTLIILRGNTDLGFLRNPLFSMKLYFVIGFFTYVLAFKICDKLGGKNFFSYKNILALRIEY